MASQRNTNSIADESQGQIRRDELHDSDQQSGNYLHKTGDSVKNMAVGATTVAQETVQGMSYLVQGAAVGAANLAQGASSTVKNTLGVNSDQSNNSNTNPSARP